MAQPTPYSRKFDFTGFSATQPSDQQPGVQIDSEYNAVKVTLDAILTNLVMIQRDDGAPKNGIVTLDTLASDVLTTLGGGATWIPKGAWTTALVYAVGNVVSNSGTTYVCAVAHTAGTFATDLAANKWVAIFGTVMASVPDNSVSTIKIVDGAVTAAKLGFTALDLTGTLRGQGGLAAGTAIAGGYTISGKAASSDAYVSIARTTRSQGTVGLRIDGGTSGSIWEARQASGIDALSFYNSLGAVTTATFNSNGTVDWTSAQRVTGWTIPASGAGLELGYSASVGLVQAYDRAGSVWKPIQVSGITVAIQASGTTVATANTGSFDITEGTVNSQPLGYRGIPQVTATAAYTLALTDAGKHISITTGGVIIPANATVAFPIGATIAVYNDSAASQSISITTDTLRLAGTATTGTRTLSLRGICTLVKVKATEWVATGNIS
ncbi:hypothetical protein UFOVP4_22 [uncultured Caudovirales phage]|uniref:Uncharacterized protein n=1 Tax=uncultured Caudovirales phage TaxID=2100421 RepID=A0A6J5T989_9CAUD|nr:hypothetical protein UFOVP4_22 [uncultured Caudovirales phage]CAB4241303.1 hypothetical protein UFOVP64_37 [uncultured Caudovirales phage]CAB5079010.1 hypothetical protein UFOVP145_51 [uncultured Caudovirales phage]